MGRRLLDVNENKMLSNVNGLPNKKKKYKKCLI